MFVLDWLWAFVVVGCLLRFVFCCGNSVGWLLLFDFILC